MVASKNGDFSFEATKNDFRVFFKDSSTAPYLVRYETKDGAIQFGLEPQQAWGSLDEVQAQAQGNVVTYANISPGVDLRYESSTREMLEEFIVSDPRQASEISEIRKRALIQGVNWRLKADGSIEFTQKETSESVWSIPRPVMYELGKPQNRDYGLHFEITPRDGYFELKKVIEPSGRAWLTDPNRRFPVVIDDTVDLDEGRETPVGMGSSRKRSPPAPTNGVPR